MKKPDGTGIFGPGTKKKGRWRRWRWRNTPTKKVGNGRSLEQSSLFTGQNRTVRGYLCIDISSLLAVSYCAVDNKVRV